METLVVVAHHRNQYCYRVRSRGPMAFGSSPPSRNFRGINCRSYQSAAGILPSPFKANASPVSKQTSSSPKTPSPCFGLGSEGKNPGGLGAKSAPIAIDAKVCSWRNLFGEEFCGEGLSFSERWAGPAYSNSPPPSSLPIPKFSIQPKRTVSLELPCLAPEVKLHPIAKSAPSSPTRGRSPCTRDLFHSADSATETLRRILNLDINDDE